MNRASPLLALLGTTLLGCAAGASPLQQAAIAAAPVPPPLETPSRRPVAHDALVVGLAVAPDGSGALTRDVEGLRLLWTDRSGHTPPLRLRGRGGSAEALRHVGAQWHAGLVDTAGRGTLVRVGPDDTILEDTQLAPEAGPMLELHPLPQGAVSLQADHSILLWGGDHRVLARIHVPEFRPTRLLVSRDGTRVVAVEVVSGAANKALRTLVVSTVDDDVDAPRSPATHQASGAVLVASMALSPDGSRLAWADGSAGALVVADLDDGTRRELRASSLLFGDGLAGWRDDHVVVLVRRTGPGASWDLSEAEASARPLPSMARVPLRQHVTVPGLSVSTGGRWVRLQETQAAVGRWVGWEYSGAVAAALSPSGRQIAALTATGALIVADVEAPGTPQVVTLRSNLGPQHVAFLDEARVIAESQWGGLAIIDLASSHQEVVLHSEGSCSTSLASDAAVMITTCHGGPGRLLQFDRRGTTPIRAASLAPDAEERRVTLSADGSELLLADASQRLVRWDIDRVWRNPTEREWQDVGAFPGRKDGTVAAIGRDGTVFVLHHEGAAWKLVAHDRGASHELPLPSPAVRVAPSPRGGGLAATTRDGVVLWRRRPTGEFQEVGIVASAEPEGVPSWSGDGRRVAVVALQRVLVVDANSGETVLRQRGWRYGGDGEGPTPNSGEPF
jgi:hypothetical protein